MMRALGEVARSRSRVLSRAFSRALTIGLVASAATASSLSAQAQPAYTLGDLLHALDVAATEAHLGATNPDARHILDSVSAVLYADGNTSLTVTQGAERIEQAKSLSDKHEVPKISWDVVNRTSRSTGALSIPDVQIRAFDEAVWTVIGLGNVEIVNALRQQHASADSITVLLKPLDAMNRATRQLAHARNQSLLNNFERKYGPKSASLNIVEVGLNYLAQFGPLRTSETSGPSPFEILANYGASSLRVGTTTDDPNKLVTNGRVGLRYYFFFDGWGGSDRVGQYLKPAYMSVGFISTGPDDQVGRVWGRGYHAGPFIGWGDFFAGYLIDPKRRIIAGVQKTLIPGVL
ncbi:MAG TPA: hypothetical protein VGM50_14800 [Gemmatimonadaceae bacterium]|jgi:hypothetical protein